MCGIKLSELLLILLTDLLSFLAQLFSFKVLPDLVV